MWPKGAIENDVRVPPQTVWLEWVERRITHVSELEYVWYRPAYCRDHNLPEPCQQCGEVARAISILAALPTPPGDEE